jgi:hypothetical protein
MAKRNNSSDTVMNINEIFVELKCVISASFRQEKKADFLHENILNSVAQPHQIHYHININFTVA